MAPIEQSPLVSDPELECMVVGYLLGLNGENAERWMARLDAQCFHNEKVQTTFKAMCDLIDMEPPQAPNAVNVQMQLTTAYPKSIVTYADMAIWMQQSMELSDLTFPIELLRDMKVRRNLQILGMRLQQAATERTKPIAPVVEEAIAELDVQDVSRQHHGTPLHDYTVQLAQRVNDNQDDQRRHHGPWTGVEALDERGGLPETGLVVLAGGTSQGKSSLASAFAMRSADHGMRTAYFSLEMNAVSLTSRIVAMDGLGVSGEGIKSWKLNDEDWRRTLHEIAQVDRKYGEMIYFDDSRSSNLQDICSGIRYMHHAYGIRLVVVDFLQLLNYTTTNRGSMTTEQLMGTAARSLKNLADRLGICVVLLCQINRSMEQQRPALGVIRDSGQIAEAADMAIFAWRPSAYHGSYDLNFAEYRTQDTMAFLVLKNREGALMERLLRWDGKHTLASDIPDHELSTFKTSYKADTTQELFPW